MTSASTRRLAKEMAELNADFPPFVTAQPDESNLRHWTGTITGPPDSAYQGGKFGIDLTFPVEYPFKSPTTTRIYHPNVTDDGAICIGLLKAEAWKPSTKIEQSQSSSPPRRSDESTYPTFLPVLRALVQLLQEPNPDDALVASIAEIYNQDRAAFNKTAQDWVKKYAQ
ncbi:SPOSA6832_01580 [Sporobolomyces salmonicolor]|uniref:SPOSA6832_01580-mRNA-1:cds n=1 Tax=Sporidiobolus salmonicolor TaxID=5005 RepID=A0A0D6EIY3_SPOSA|nr:SPOSA6832_01580 [Sporobolomyces salmonicolor]